MTISRGEPLKMQELHEGRVDVSTRKRPIVPKTQGQNRYLEAIRKNDIVIGIGPAGTGEDILTRDGDGGATRCVATA